MAGRPPAAVDPTFFDRWSPEMAWALAPGPSAIADNGHYVKLGAACAGARRRHLARDLRLFRQLLPDRRPHRNLQADLLAEARDLGGEGLADLVVVATLEAIRAIAHV